MGGYPLLVHNCRRRYGEMTVVFKIRVHAGECVLVTQVNVSLKIRVQREVAHSVMQCGQMDGVGRPALEVTF